MVNITTNVAGTNSYVGFDYEATYATAGSPIDKCFGHGQKITVSVKNNMEKVYGIGNQNFTAAIAKKYEGNASIEATMGNPWWFYGVLGSPVAAVWTGSPVQWFTYTFNEANSIPSMTIENGTDLDTDVARTLRGAVMSSVTLTAAVNELVKLKFECPYSNEQYTTTLIAAGTRPTDANDPFVFQNGTLSIAGSSFAELQNVEFNINRNPELVWGIGSRFATNHVEKEREYNLKATLSFKDVTEFLKRMYGGAGSPVNTSPNAETTAFLKFNNGGSGTAQRVVQINLGSVYFDEHTLPHDPAEVIKEDVQMFAMYCGSVTYIAGSMAIP
jgi:hypothetical protein